MEPVLLHLLAWSALPFVAILNGLVRERTYGKHMSPTLAHSLAVIPLVVIIVGWALALAGWVPLDAPRARLVGAGWFVLTLFFEFGMGAMRGRSPRVMLREWDVRRGRLWPLVPVATFASPMLARLVVGG